MILGCGVDLIAVGRIERELTRRGKDPFDDLFTSDELAWCCARRHPAEGYALGFAAKEAVMKALGTGLVGRMRWTDICVRWPEPGATHWPAGDARRWPTVSLRGETAVVAGALGVDHVLLTATLRRPTRSRLKPASTTVAAGHTGEPASASARSAPPRPAVAWRRRSAGSRTGAMAAAWVVLTGGSGLAPGA